MEKSFWHALLSWFHENCYTPDWMPARWRQPLSAYLLAGLVTCVVVALDAVIYHLFSLPELIDVPMTLAILLVALTWGAGPALVVTVLGTLLVYYVVVPPPFMIRWKDLVDIFQDGGVLIGGLLITLVVSQHHAQRRAGEAHAQDEAEQRRKMDAFLEVVAHELKTPLTTIGLQLQLVQRRINEGLLTVALQQWERLDQLVNNLLEMSQIQTDHVVLYLQPVDVLPLVETTVTAYRQETPDRTIKLILPPPSPTTPTTPTGIRLIADSDRLEQVLRSYLSNAVKFSRETAPITVGVAAERGSVRVWVRDEGPGVPLADQARIWERFYQVPGIAVQSGSSIGTGIGLYLSRAIIEAHHGHVGVDSTPGQGATFWFTLPQSVD